jgi:hypothetical protein
LWVRPQPTSFLLRLLRFQSTSFDNFAGSMSITLVIPQKLRPQMPAASVAVKSSWKFRYTYKRIALFPALVGLNYGVGESAEKGPKNETARAENVG